MKPLVLILTLAWLCGCQLRYGSGSPEKLYGLAQEVRQVKFATARIMNDSITYYDDERRETGKSPLPKAVLQQMGDQKVLYIEDNSEGILFVLGGAVDDVWGLLYAPSGRVNMDGILKLKRAEKDWFYFSSF